jgi:hypothetical protein
MQNWLVACLGFPWTWKWFNGKLQEEPHHQLRLRGCHGRRKIISNIRYIENALIPFDPNSSDFTRRYQLKDGKDILMNFELSLLLEVLMCMCTVQKLIVDVSTTASTRFNEIKEKVFSMLPSYPLSCIWEVAVNDDQISKQVSSTSSRPRFYSCIRSQPQWMHSEWRKC